MKQNKHSRSQPDQLRRHEVRPIPPRVLARAIGGHAGGIGDQQSQWSDGGITANDDWESRVV
jgi:hypothetical protein